MKRSLLLAGIALVTLVGCNATTPPTDDNPSSEDSSVTMEETKNVLYRGTLEEAGVSIFMQGTHQLVLDDGRSILLESEVVNLDHYVGQKVEVFGSVRPTVESGGQIMRVESVSSLEASSSSLSSEGKIFCGGIAGFTCPDGMTCVDDPSDSCDPLSGGADCGGMCVPSGTSASSVAQTSSVAASTAPASSIATSSLPSLPSSSSMPSAWEGSADLTAKAAIMAKDNMAAANWTQQYCSTHIGFCIPVHKNWWFKSFGATSSSFWHVEIGPSEMNNLGEGPITVRLVSGEATSDGQVGVSGGVAAGQKAWTGGRHFEIRGPSNLEEAVRYITEQLKTATP